MRILLYVLLALVIVAIVFVLLKKVAKSFISKIVIIGVAMCVFGGAGSIINLNTLSAEVQAQVDSVVDTLGSSAIRQSGGTVEVKLGTAWYDIAKLWVSHEGSDITITYDGVKIPVAKTGIASTIEVLESVGLIK